MTGPLDGIRVIELGGIGPGPHACMILADLGADVVRVEAPGASLLPGGVQRGRRIVRADLKNALERDEILELISSADVVVEGFRPGVTERLGLGPEDCWARDPRIVYGRITGWGQEGALALSAGHDIDYLALTGVLSMIHGADRKPVPPANLLGDFGGGSLFLVVGVLAALLERERSGRGQVVDAAIVDGVGILAQMLWDFRASPLGGVAGVERPLGGDLPFYDTYRCADGRYLAVGPIEPRFYAAFLDGLGVDPEGLPSQWDPAGWTSLREVFTGRIAKHTRDEWVSRFEGTDACVAPVLNWDEALTHAHLVERGVFRLEDGAVQVTPAPRFSRTVPSAAPRVEIADIEEVAAQWRARSQRPHPMNGTSYLPTLDDWSSVSKESERCT